MRYALKQIGVPVAMARVIIREAVALGWLERVGAEVAPPAVWAAAVAKARRPVNAPTEQAKDAEGDWRGDPVVGGCYS